MWEEAKCENLNSHQTLKEQETNKLRKAILLTSFEEYSYIGAENNIPFRKKCCRRFDRSKRTRKKRNSFWKQIHSNSIETKDTMNELDPINLSSINIEEDQITLLRKGPSFCPTPKDTNWQEVYDDYEVFETRLRTELQRI